MPKSHLKKGKGERGYQPLVFTESGIAMLSSVLRSERAVTVNTLIMRTFLVVASLDSSPITIVIDFNFRQKKRPLARSKFLPKLK